MRFAFIYGRYCLQYRQFDFTNIWDDPRGLTGSELSYLRVALGMAARGHEVHLYTLVDRCPGRTWEGLRVHDLDEWVGEGADVAISWNEAEPLRVSAPGTFRVVSYQLNNFDHCMPDSDSFVDIWASPSKIHLDLMTTTAPSIGGWFHIHGRFYDNPDLSKWAVVPHGCDLDNYDRLAAAGVGQVPGRVIWASSPDRGLHWLLQEWPKIKRAIPHANLRIFYALKPWLDRVDGWVSHSRDSVELKSRSLYIREAIRRLEGHGIEVLDSVSRNRINREMHEAEVMAYSCDPVSWTEGFSVTLMEACASRTCPVTTAVDALPGVYGGVIPMVDPPLRDNIGEFSDLVIKALSDSEYRAQVNRRVREFAERNTWDKVVDDLEKLIISRRG